MNQDIAACAAIVEKGDPDRFMAIMSGTVELREKLFPLYAFNIEVARAPWVTQESMIAEMRLQWWRDALEEIAEGQDVRRHEVVTPLAQILSPDQARALDRVVQARRWDIYKDPFEDEIHFKRHLSETAGQLLVTAAELAGATKLSSVRKIGEADGLARWFQAIPALEQSGRVPMADGRHEAVRALAGRALEKLSEARMELGPVTQELAAALRLAWCAKPILQQAANAPSRVAEGSLGIGDFRRKSSLLWKSLNASW